GEGSSGGKQLRGGASLRLPRGRDAGSPPPTRAARSSSEAACWDKYPPPLPQALVVVVCRCLVRLVCWPPLSSQEYSARC
ncbi:unnamed protein product, partial [Prorocentrum cordatum]